MNLRQLSCNGVLLVAFLLGMIIPGVSLGQTSDQPIRQEYFVQQAADEDLLIMVNAFEAEFESKISGQDGNQIMLSAIPGSRIAPVFQYIDAADAPRQLDIEVSSNLHTNRSQFGLEVARMKVWDKRSEAVSQAYRLLSDGLEISESDSKSNWTVKIDRLVNAGRIFQQFGMKEMRLWSNYLAAHLVYFHLKDHSIVYSMTREILAELKGARLQKIELAALQLQSAALIALKKNGSLGASASGTDPVQSVLSRVVILAESMGYRFEQARALTDSGMEYASEALYARALEQFQSAVAVADLVGETELATEIRESIVDIHSLQGNAPDTGEVLRQIETQLVEDGGGDELALNLLAQGRLLSRSYRHGQALDVLLQARNYENNSAIRTQINFELAKVYFAAGRMDESLAYLELAGIRTTSTQNGRVNSILDVGDGLRILADIYRIQGDYPAMRAARSTQARYRPVQAAYLYDQGLDELAASGAKQGRAQSLFEQSYAAARKAGDVDLQHLARLQFCALAAVRSPTGSMCSGSEIKSSYDSLVTGGVPRYSVQAMLLWARILVGQGRYTEAVPVMDRLLDEVHFLRHSLLGVLGSWYREYHEYLFEYYVDLLVSNDIRRGRADDAASLLALSKIRFIENYTDGESAASAQPESTELMRTQLAQRESATPGPLQQDLSDSIERGMALLRKPFETTFDFLSKSGLQRHLKRLDSDEVVLTYHISPVTAQVWIAQKNRVQRRTIPGPGYIYGALQEAQQGLANIGKSSFDSKMDALGKRLLEPVADLLVKNIYWVPAGPLLGFPLDALRIKGRYLVERHSVVNLLSFPSPAKPVETRFSSAGLQVFLAGHPQDYSSDYETRLDTSPEIRAVTDIFVGPGLHIVQGAALLPDEFEDEHFRQADLVHLSMPGFIDLRYPEKSYLELSGDENGTGRASLRSLDIRSQELDAGLVFLSSAGVRNDPISEFSNQPGLIADFTRSGAHSVIANLWAGNGPATEVFIVNFYRKLVDSEGIARSLGDAKRQYLIDNRDTGLYDWAGYQLFIE